MGLLESLRNRGGLLGTVGQTLTDYQQLANAYPNASKFAEGLIKNLSAVAPPDPRNQQQSMQYAINRAFDVPGGFGGAIDVWHGSPHKFDAFDMSKIGTGEGAQAYGHGLYFAENPEIAEGYKKALSGGSYVDKRGMPVQPNEIASDIYEAARKGGADVQEASDASSFWSLYLRDGDKMSNSPGYKYIKDVIDGRGITFKDHGNLYNVSLEWPDAAKETSDPLGPQHFLDLSKNLGEQADEVKNALGLTKAQRMNEKNFQGFKDEMLRKYGSIPAMSEHDKDTYRKLFDLTKNEVDSDAYRAIMGETYYDRISNKLGSPVDASNRLKELGIPGIRYLDGGSRGAGNGSYNYVVFDDQIPRILERNGIGLLNSLKR